MCLEQRRLGEWISCPVPHAVFALRRLQQANALLTVWGVHQGTAEEKRREAGCGLRAPFHSTSQPITTHPFQSCPNLGSLYQASVCRNRQTSFCLLTIAPWVTAVSPRERMWLARESMWLTARPLLLVTLGLLSLPFLCAETRQ